MLFRAQDAQKTGNGIDLENHVTALMGKYVQSREGHSQGPGGTDRQVDQFVRRIDPLETRALQRLAAPGADGRELEHVYRRDIPCHADTVLTALGRIVRLTQNGGETRQQILCHLFLRTEIVDSLDILPPISVGRLEDDVAPFLEGFLHICERNRGANRRNGQVGGGELLRHEELAVARQPYVHRVEEPRTWDVAQHGQPLDPVSPVVSVELRAVYHRVERTGLAPPSA
ncbi:hypothetical protein LUW77_30180 [Streptomyces radiopugnans]|nr:hypothetical protein LUW77_30180 [Streptomyces radiopugnans]